ncbi:Uma2 family endonuclease [Synechocystis sp. PCC 7339]|uniref:Uma2 family endonuclease n=1 Tax=unclassified Synechocystis TaxID=2640012 RepID=UPI001BAF504A|nr:MULTISPECIES: Uma2 family endonuclease [unclassified Synechocystis]QUS60002.1 Uma2 family endonuclease [Synechocystis sp. PCC 7338]UAJ72548.1 Uma2 family endonuclease [Synechocystis sp. PCC 7339]
MNNLLTKPLINSWIIATWDEYIQQLDNLKDQYLKSYYYQGHMRVEMSPVSFDHGQDHVMIIFAVNLFIALRQIPATGLDTTTFRKSGVRECQPDVAYYLGENARTIPSGTGIVNLDQYPSPNLVVEISRSSLLDDLGIKRSLYEDLGVREYWIVDVQKPQLFAYSVANLGSQRITTSQVLPGLEIGILEEVLQRSRHSNQAEVGYWLLKRFQQ